MTSTNQHLTNRPRRLRRTASLRRMVRENQLTVNDLIYPVFVMEGENQQEEILSMPEIYRYSLDLLLKEIADAASLGINAVRGRTGNRFPILPFKTVLATFTAHGSPWLFGTYVLFLLIPR